MDEPELDLGLPPKKVRPPRRDPNEVPPPQATRKWARYTAASRRFCDTCMGKARKIGGVPTHSINRAHWTEDGPEGRYWLCHPCKADREIRFGSK